MRRRRRGEGGGGGEWGGGEGERTTTFERGFRVYGRGEGWISAIFLGYRQIENLRR